MGRKRAVLVTGAASGIGAAVCRAMAAPGVALLVHTRKNRAGAERVATEARAADFNWINPGGGDWGDPPSMIRSAFRSFGPGPGATLQNYRSGGVSFRVARTLN